MVAQKKHLIVTGTARSGTTALAELLNAHEEICVGIERFKFQFLLQHNYDAGLFERQRFFDFRKEDTNLRPAIRPGWQGVYDLIAAKWDKATLIGDKVPDLTPVLRRFMAANPDFKYIYILRNLKDVGLSWQARANRVRDNWPAGKGFEAACASWEQQMRMLHDLTQKKALRGKILLLDYDRMYDEDSRADQAILNFLGVGPSAAFAATYKDHVAFARARLEKRIPAQFAEIYKKTDMSFARDLRRRSRNQIIRLTTPPEAAAAPEAALQTPAAR